MKKTIIIVAIVFAISFVTTAVLKKKDVNLSQASTGKKPPIENVENPNAINQNENDFDGKQTSESKKQEKINFEDLTRTNSEGAVTIDLTFLNLQDDDSEFWVFEIAMNTHSVNLQQYDYSNIIIFKADQNKEIQKDLIIETKGAGHHIVHYLKVPKVIDGNKTITDNTQTISIIIKNIDNIPNRTFLWDLTQLR